MSCIMKYRPKNSNQSWRYYEDGSAKRCEDFLLENEYEEDYEYEIYEFSKEGVVHGFTCDDEYDFFETKLEYLFDLYHCDSIPTLKTRCPIDLDLIDLESEATEEFKKAMEKYK